MFLNKLIHPMMPLFLLFLFLMNCHLPVYGPLSSEMQQTRQDDETGKKHCTELQPGYTLLMPVLFCESSETYYLFREHEPWTEITKDTYHRYIRTLIHDFLKSEGEDLQKYKDSSIDLWLSSPFLHPGNLHLVAVLGQLIFRLPLFPEYGSIRRGQLSQIPQGSPAQFPSYKGVLNGVLGIILKPGHSADDVLQTMERSRSLLPEIRLLRRSQDYLELEIPFFRMDHTLAQVRKVVECRDSFQSLRYLSPDYPIESHIKIASLSF
ncbi:MAG: hypothetical protein H6618_03190 [Deltaproteobacteria bacterium]|nr:hypothetical protein [Deltaproteobacteria bacterium]